MCSLAPMAIGTEVRNSFGWMTASTRRVAGLSVPRPTEARIVCVVSLRVARRVRAEKDATQLEKGYDPLFGRRTCRALRLLAARWSPSPSDLRTRWSSTAGSTRRSGSGSSRPPDSFSWIPDNGAPATEQTEVRIAFSRERLYIGVTCHDSNPSGIRGKQMLRDADLGSDDRFMWSIDTYLNGRTGYYFETNPVGALGDGLIAQGDSGPTAAGGTVNRQWDGIWIARVVQNETGWTAEIELPFRTLNFDPTPARGASTFSAPCAGRTKRPSGLVTPGIRDSCG